MDGTPAAGVRSRSGRRRARAGYLRRRTERAQRRLLQLVARPRGSVHLFADEPAVALLEASEASLAEIGSWCERHGVEAWYVRRGGLGVVTSAAQQGRGAMGRCRPPSRPRADRIVPLSAEEVASRILLPYRGSGIYAPGEATAQPARLARGLRRIVLGQGARIFAGTPVARARTTGPILAETPAGSVPASSAVLGADALARLGPLRRSLVVRGTYIVLTAPAPERLAEIGWTGGESLWNFRAALNYVATSTTRPASRVTASGRLSSSGGSWPAESSAWKTS